MFSFKKGGRDHRKAQTIQAYLQNQTQHIQSDFVYRQTFIKPNVLQGSMTTAVSRTISC